jgi:hypothetical protein
MNHNLAGVVSFAKWCIGTSLVPSFEEESWRHDEY